MHRSLYIPDAEKEQMKPGDDIYINKVPDVSRYSIESVKFWNLQKFADKLGRITVPKLFFKVLRGNRLVVYSDEIGNLIPTEKLALVIPKAEYLPLLPYFMVLLNSRIPSFFIEKMIFSETTEASRVMDEPYVGKLPIRIVESEVIDFISFIGKSLKLVSQWAFEKDHEELRRLQSRLEALAEAYSMIIYLKGVYEREFHILRKVSADTFPELDLESWWKEYLIGKRDGTSTEPFEKRTTILIADIDQFVTKLDGKSENGPLQAVLDGEISKAMDEMFKRKY
jgi:hypothetical protein